MSLNDGGNVPDSRDKLIIVVMGLIKISNKALRMFVGIRSRSHYFDADFIMIFLTLLKRHNRAEIIKKSVFLFWLLNMTISWKDDHRLAFQNSKF